MLGGLVGTAALGGYALYQHLNADATTTVATSSSPSVASQTTSASMSTIPTVDEYQQAYTATSGNDPSMMTQSNVPATTYTASVSSDTPAVPTIVNGTPTISTQSGALTGQNVNGGALGAPTTPATPIPTPLVTATTTTTTTKKATPALTGIAAIVAANAAKSAAAAATAKANAATKAAAKKSTAVKNT